MTTEDRPLATRHELDELRAGTDEVGSQISPVEFAEDHARFALRERLP
ncbi:MAG: hypothetical protein ABJC10_04190 [Acidobacteriota bacterium]